MAGRTVVVKVSGKLVNPRNPSLVESYASMFRKLYSGGYRLIVVVGGGPIAREYIEAGEKLGLNKAVLDLLGIEASRLNARLLIYALYPQAYPEPPRSVWELLEAYASGRIVVCGGFQPGQSTTGVAAVAAEAVKASLLVIATTVAGVYTADPRRAPDAKLIPRLTYDEYRRVISQSVEPGKYELLDPLALTVVERSGIPVRVVDGSNPENVARAVYGEDIGSLIA